MSLLVVGSIALDTVKTPLEEHADILGGSASYAAVSASFFTPVNLVGVVGDDFPAEYRDLFNRQNINTQGLQVEKGKTFRWTGEYEWDMNNRRTLFVALNVFENFKPQLPESYKKTPYVLLANIHPALQLSVLSQIEAPRFVVADTMDLWIEVAQEELKQVLAKVDMLILNDSEAREFMKETSLVKAGAKLMKLGPKYVAIKKGEHGCLLFGEGKFFSAPAFPLEDIHDPTGAGDTFAGALLGYVASQGNTSFESLKKAVVYGSTMASFNVEAFSLNKLQTLTQDQIQQRYRQFKMFSHFDDL
ncbi:MAG: PfkB family carbohydrate kinase [Verrucomicrobiota bacterium]|nr:PfkB family carbohydrate kinase [Verrucomicrobiota bacterium]